MRMMNFKTFANKLTDGFKNFNSRIDSYLRVDTGNANYEYHHISSMQNINLIRIG